LQAGAFSYNPIQKASSKMRLLIELREKFTDESDGPIVNELLEILHFMGVEETEKAAFCRQVVIPGGREFLTRFQKMSKSGYRDREAKFIASAQFLDKTAPAHLKLCPAS